MIWVGFHPTFSRQSKANKFTLVFWLIENVGFAFVLSPWHSLSKLSLCSSGLSKTFRKLITC